MRFWWLLIVLAASLVAAPAVEQTFVLRESLGFTWSRELVTFPFTAKIGACAAGAVSLTGPRGSVPVQLTDVVYWPRTQWVKTARAAFIADLAPLATDTYTLHYGPNAGKTNNTSDLQVDTQPDRCTLATSVTGVRLLAGEKTYTPPAAPADVPGPLQGLRLVDGTWVGSSGLCGTKKITGYVAHVSENGPVFARAGVRYTYEDGQTLDITVQLAAGEGQAQWSCASSADAPQDGWQLRLSPGLEDVRLPLKGEFGNNRWNKLNEITAVELRKEPAGTITSLQPWPDWWDGQTQAEWTFELPARGKVLTMASRDPGAWVTPLPPGSQGSWGQWTRKMISLVREAAGIVTLHINNADGRRVWTLGTPGASVGHRLEVVKDYVLDQVGTVERQHPHLYLTRNELTAFRAVNPVDPQQINKLVALSDQWSPEDQNNFHALPYAARAYVLTGSSAVAERVQLKKRYLILLNEAVHEQNFDFMRCVTTLVSLYDIVIDSGLLTPEEQRLVRARMLYVGYILSDPRIWSVERGYCSGNPDMSVLFILNLGYVGCLFPDHPCAKVWVSPALARMAKWLNEDVGPAGEWTEGPHYMNVSLLAMLSFAVAAKNADFKNFVDTEPLKRMALYAAKSFLPPDPRYSNQRTNPPCNTSGERWASAGMMAFALRKSDPALSAQLQWLWLASGESMNTGVGAMLGFEDIVLNRKLPAKAPAWNSEINRNFVKFNHGFNTVDEHFFFAPANSNGMIWGYEAGAINALYSYGKPLSVLFGIYYGNPMSRESLLQSRVLASRDWGKRNASSTTETDNLTYDNCAITAIMGSCQPRQDYARWTNMINGPITARFPLAKNLPAWPTSPSLATGPVTWTRQVLFLKGNLPQEPAYYLFRDTVSGKQPTEWTMWTMSELLGTPAAMANPAQVLTAKPGNTVQPTRELPHSDRYTALGQFDVDMEYYIASPAESPRHTMRWGVRLTNGHNGILEGLGEYQDLLHLRLPGDGTYFIAFYPHKRGTAAPTFTTLGDGTVIKVAGESGTDYGFLSVSPGTATAEAITFTGTCASVQLRNAETTMSLGADGTIKVDLLGISSPAAVSARVTSNQVTLDLPSQHPAQRVTLWTPMALTAPSGVVPCQPNTDGSYTLTVPANMTQVMLKEKISPAPAVRQGKR